MSDSLETRRRRRAARRKRQRLYLAVVVGSAVLSVAAFAVALSANRGPRQPDPPPTPAELNRQGIADAQDWTEAAERLAKEYEAKDKSRKR